MMQGEAAPVNGRMMFIVAAIGFVVNIILLVILGDEHGHSHGHLHGHGHDNHTHTHHHFSGHHEEHTHDKKKGYTTCPPSEPGNADELSRSSSDFYGSCSKEEVFQLERQKKKVVNINLSGAVLHAVSAPTIGRR